MDGATDAQSPAALAALEKIKTELSSPPLNGRGAISVLSIKVKWGPDELKELGNMKKFLAMHPDVFEVSGGQYVTLKDFNPEAQMEVQATAPKLGSSKAPGMGMAKGGTTAGIPAPRKRGWEDTGTQGAPQFSEGKGSAQDCSQDAGWAPDAGGKGYGAGKGAGKGGKAAPGPTPPASAPPTGKAKWAPPAKAAAQTDDAQGSTSFVPKSLPGKGSSMPVPPKNPPPMMGAAKRPPPQAGVSRPKWAPPGNAGSGDTFGNLLDQAAEDMEQAEEDEAEGSWAPTGEPAWKVRKGDAQGKGGKLPTKTSDWQSEGPYGKASSKGATDGKGAADWQGKGEAQPEEKGFAKGDGKGKAGYGCAGGFPAAKFPPQSKQQPAPAPKAAEALQPSKGSWQEDELADEELAGMITSSKVRGIELELVALSRRLAGTDEMKKAAAKLTNFMRSTCLKVHRKGMLGPGLGVHQSRGAMPPTVEFIGSYLQGTEIDGAELDIALRMPAGTSAEQRDAFSKDLSSELSMSQPPLPTLTVTGPLQHFAHAPAAFTVEFSSEQPAIMAHVILMDPMAANPAERPKSVDLIIKSFCEASEVAREMVRLVKLWACNHGLASAADGFMGGVCWTVLALCFLQKERLLLSYSATLNGEQPPRQNSRPQVFVLLRSFMQFLVGLGANGVSRGFSVIDGQEFQAPAILFLEDPAENLAQQQRRNMAEGLGEAQFARICEEAKKAADRLSSRPQRWFHWAEIFDPREVPKDKIAKLAPLREIAGLVAGGGCGGGKAGVAIPAKSAMLAEAKSPMAPQAKNCMGGKGFAPGGSPGPAQGVAGGAVLPKSNVPAAFGGKGGAAALPARLPGKGGAPGMMYGKQR